MRALPDQAILFIMMEPCRVVTKVSLPIKAEQAWRPQMLYLSVKTSLLNF